MFLYKTTLKPSPIHGLGVFATEIIKKGVAVYKHRPDLDLVLSATKYGVLDQRDQLFIAHHGGFDKRLRRYRLPYDHLRFLNHSDSPNLVYREATDQIIALRDIEPGEELTQDYRDFEDNVEQRIAQSNKEKK